MEALDLIRQRVAWCEEEGIEILCCPEAVLGGLADYAADPGDIAIDVEGGQLDDVLAPLASDRVTSIVGFTEVDAAGRLYNAAAVLHRGVVVGLYRKRHPAIRTSVYQPGDRTPIFWIGGLAFGILICNDSNHPEVAGSMAAQGAAVLFVPTNNGLPLEKADVVEDAQRVDVALAGENGVWVVRADVAGQAGGRVSYGSSAIVAPDGRVLRCAQRLAEDLLVAEIATEEPVPDP